MTYGHAYASPSPGAAESALAAPTPASPVPTSLPTPVPETPPQTSSGAYTVQAASAAGSVTGPFGTPFAGGGGDACIGWPPVRPPDVAAECHRPRAPNYLMRGSGYLTGRETSHTSLSNFWCPSGSASPLPGRATNTLVDSQIAFDHIAQRWLATTLSVAPDKTGNLYFAASNTSSAAGTWTLYARRCACHHLFISMQVPEAAEGAFRALK
jgi:hypothetical protein